MTFLEIFGIAFAPLCTIIVAWITYQGNKERKNTERFIERMQAISEAREKAEKLNTEFQYATCKLTTIMAKSMTGQHLNGDVEDALATAVAAQEKYDTFLKDVARQALLNNQQGA